MDALVETKQNKKNGGFQAVSKDRQSDAFKRHLKEFSNDAQQADLNSSFQHDFSRVQVQSALPPMLRTSNTSACPLSPRTCPTGGVCHTCPAKVQAKLTINQPGDSYEQEADRIAAQLMQILQPAETREERETLVTETPQILQRLPENQTSALSIPPSVHEVISSPGQPLDTATRSFTEPHFGYDFSQVRVHTDERAAQSAQALNARAYTLGQNIVFDSGQYNPLTVNGQQLLTHELAHVVQQRGAVSHHIQCERRGGTGVTVRSPVVEETVTQASEIAGSLAGRELTQSERDLARPIFGRSLDFNRVRLVSSDRLSYRTVGNNIYVPDDFTIRNAQMAQTLIHELTHVWQYQHSGTSYISVSLGAQITAAISRGSRNFAYAYSIQPNQTFFDFNPEQQGSIVENYFAMLRDQREIPRRQAAGDTRTYASNHLDANGFPRRLSATQRLAEISSELSQHERLIRQMRAAMPRTEVDVLQLRTMDLMQTPGQRFLPVPEERQLMPVRPLLEIRFPGL